MFVQLCRMLLRIISNLFLLRASCTTAHSQVRGVFCPNLGPAAARMRKLRAAYRPSFTRSPGRPSSSPMRVPARCSPSPPTSAIVVGRAERSSSPPSYPSCVASAAPDAVAGPHDPARWWWRSGGARVALAHRGGAAAARGQPPCHHGHRPHAHRRSQVCGAEHMTSPFAAIESRSVRACGRRPARSSAPDAGARRAPGVGRAFASVIACDRRGLSVRTDQRA